MYQLFELFQHASALDSTQSRQFPVKLIHERRLNPLPSPHTKDQIQTHPVVEPWRLLVKNNRGRPGFASHYGTGKPQNFSISAETLLLPVTSPWGHPFFLPRHAMAISYWGIHISGAKVPVQPTKLNSLLKGLLQNLHLSPKLTTITIAQKQA